MDIRNRSTMKRIWILGPPGSGKTTLGRLLSEEKDIPFFELDSYYWEENWNKVDEEEFREKVLNIISNNPMWLIEGQYSNIKDIVLQKVDTIICLDVSIYTVLKRVIKRSTKRILTKERLWSNNVENISMVFGRFIPYILKNHNKNRLKNKKMLEELKNHPISIFCFDNQSTVLQILNILSSQKVDEYHDRTKNS